MKRAQEIRILMQDYLLYQGRSKKTPRQRLYRTFKKSF